MPERGSSQYPFAAAPDIIRSNQKDAYFQGVLVEHVSAVLRNSYGARFVHRYASEVRSFGDLLYFCCTTLIANRTLGEEYCDIVQIESNSLKLPSLRRRSGYIISAVIFPYLLNKILPGLRVKVKGWLENSLVQFDQTHSSNANTKLRRYVLQNLSALTSTGPVYAVGLAIFYFSGAYYHVSKRFWGLRYLFTKRIDPSDQRIGYEVLGVLLILQLSVQAWLHIQNTYNMELPSLAGSAPMAGGAVIIPGGIEMGLGPPQADDILLEQAPISTSREAIEAHTSTPVLPGARYQLSDPSVMKWVEGRQQRKCTLCLEEFKDPSITTCGHAFCWTCISDWIKEKPECPLCRQHVLTQHVLPLRE